MMTSTIHRHVAQVAALSAVLAGALVSAACSGNQAAASNRITPDYDPQTGKLQLLKYDANGNGTIDTWAYMDGARVVRIEIDSNEDGRIDRWEHYDAAQKLEKVGFSRADDGKEDAWAYRGTDGAIVRIEISTHRDGKVTRIEHFAQSRLVSAEEATGADGRIDKWETYDGDRLASIAFDTTHRGTPDRRLVYGPNGTATVEAVDAAGAR